MNYWNGETVPFMKDASEYGCFHRQLAEVLRAYLPEEGKVCEAGCGLGYLTRALAPFCREITGADASAEAIDFLKSQSLPENLTPLCIDAFRLEETYDAMVFCCFGAMEDILAIARRSCRGTVIAAKRNCAHHRFSVSQNREGLDGEAADRLLKQQGIPYRKQPVSLEFGQPFRNLEDAVRFFRLYDRSGGEITPELVAPRLQPMTHPEFSLYLPSQRQMNLYVFSANDIP